jgi:hypothetical protein
MIFALMTGFDRPLSQLLFFMPQYYTIKMAIYALLSFPRFDFAYKLYKGFFASNLKRFKSFSGTY